MLLLLGAFCVAVTLLSMLVDATQQAQQNAAASDADADLGTTPNPAPEDPHHDDHIFNMGIMYSAYYHTEEYQEHGVGHTSFEMSKPTYRGTAKRCQPRGFLKNSTECFDVVKTRYRPEKVCCYERKTDGMRGLVPAECCEGTQHWEKFMCEKVLKDLCEDLKEDDIRAGKTPGGDRRGDL